MSEKSNIHEVAEAVAPSELRQFLLHALPDGFPILVKGAPGVGKTDIIQQAVNELDYDLLVSHPVVHNPIDYRGLPGIVEGKAQFLPFGDLQRMLDAEKPLAVFIDDIGQAPSAVQAACMQLLLAREINGQPISEHVRFVAATNRRQDKAGVSSILEPVKSRFLTILQLEPNADEWLDWAAKAKLNPLVRAFIHTRKELISKFEPSADIVNSPSPRTVAHVSRIIGMNLPSTLEDKAIAGAVGQGWSIEFTGFKSVWQSLPDFDMLIANPDSYTPDSEDMSVMYAITIGLASRAGLDYEAEDTEWRTRNFSKFMQKLPDEYSILGMKELTKQEPEIITTDVFQNEWAELYRDLTLEAA